MRRTKYGIAEMSWDEFVVGLGLCVGVRAVGFVEDRAVGVIIMGSQRNSNGLLEYRDNLGFVPLPHDWTACYSEHRLGRGMRELGSLRGIGKRLSSSSIKGVPHLESHLEGVPSLQSASFTNNQLSLHLSVFVLS
jgi:hypothetical protein